MKTIIFYLFIITSITAQNNLAKLEYLEAESSFSAKEYKESLVHLNKVKELLGSGNSKIMSLEIMVKEGLLYSEDYSNFNLLKSNYELAKHYVSVYGETVDLAKLKPIYKLSKKYKVLLDNFKEKVVKPKIDYEALVEKMTAEDVINKHITAIGGREKLLSIKTIETRGTLFELTRLMKCITKLEAPNKFSISGSTDELGALYRFVFNGKKNRLTRLGVDYEYGKEANKEFSNSNVISEELLLSDENCKLLSAEDIEGKAMFKLKSKKSVRFYNVKTGLLYRVIRDEDNLVTHYSDYKLFDGFLLATKVTAHLSGELVSEEKIESVILNKIFNKKDFK